MARLLRGARTRGAVWGTCLSAEHPHGVHTQKCTHTVICRHPLALLFYCSLLIFTHTHILSPHIMKHIQTHQLVYSCEDIVLNCVNILGAFLNLNLTPRLTSDTVFIFVLASTVKPLRYTSTSKHTHPYKRSVQIHKIMERRYQIMNPLPSFSGRWMARRVEIEFLDFITPVFCCIVSLCYEATSNHSSPTGNQATGVC